MSSYPTIVDPLILAALRKFDLITEEQERAELILAEREWDFYRYDHLWWSKTARIAWANTASWWERIKNVGIPPYEWEYEWIKERRGW